MKHILLAFAASLVTLTAAARELPLKVYCDDESRLDTVYRSTLYVIGVTEPGASATINGDTAHVYRTGSFGAELTLRPGANKITLAARKGRDKASTSFTTVYVADRPAPARAAAPATEPLAESLAVKTLPGAYLQYGNGGDRLGGSKMGYLDTDIVLKAVGQTDRLYQVALGDSRTAYVPKEYVETATLMPSTVNTGSATISNMGTFDRLTLALPARVPYWSRAEIDPQTILVTLYGVTNNSNWITQYNNLGIIDFVDFRQTASDQLTLVIRLRDKYQWGYHVEYNDSRLCVDVRHRPASLELKDLTIGLDAGHGGKYPGAFSPSGLKEKDVNLDIVLNVAGMLRAKGAKVVLTRDGDTGPSMSERKDIWREANVDIAISVHNNASGNPLKPMGTSCYYKHISNRALAAALHESILTLGVADFGLTGNFNFSLNAPTEYPNALVEALFMSSLPEEELLADPDYRRALAAKIVAGLESYLRQAEGR